MFQSEVAAPKSNTLSMKFRILALFPFACILLFNGCATSNVSSVNRTGDTPKVDVNVIAMAPNNSLLGEAVAIELFNRGLNIIDSADTAVVFARLGITEIEISKPQNMRLLKAEGIDAYLIVKSAGGDDNLPQSATARLTSTESGKILAGVTWQNGWGGQSGSPVDRLMRKGLGAAAKQLVDELAKVFME